MASSVNAECSNQLVKFKCLERPSFGSEGQPSSLSENIFQLYFSKQYIHHYDVTITPGNCPIGINRKVIQNLIKKYSSTIFAGQCVVFDGRKTMYSKHPLPTGRDKLELESQLPDTEGNGVFTVSIKWVTQVSLAALEDVLNGEMPQLQLNANHALNTIIRDLPSTVSPNSQAMEGFRCPNRPNFGSKGNAIILRANHFKIGVKKSFIQHYTISMLPDNLSKRHRRNIFEKLLQVYSSIFAGQLPVFDGIENIYSKDPLPMIKGKLELEVLLPDDERVKVKVLIQWISQLSLPDFSGSANELNNKMPYSSIQALDVIMRYSASLRYTPIGRSFFQPPENSNQSLGGGRQVWYGHFQNVQLSCWKNMLNMDVAAAAFYKAQSVEKFMMEVLGITEMSRQTRPLCESQRKKFCKEITGLKVEVTHSGYKRKYKVTGVTSRSARTQSFPLHLEAGQTVECTVVKYFREKYNIILEFPYLPCLTVGKKERHTYFPLEVCSIVKGQKCNKRLTDFQASGMINATALSARDREREINNLVLQANFNENPHLRKFDISVNTEMTVVRGRVLSPPMILYAGPNKAEPRLGVWDGREKPFVKAVVIEIWAIASFVPQESLRGEMLESFALELHRKARSAGLHIKRPPSYRYADNTQIELFFRKLKSQFPELQLVCVVLPPKNKIYPEIKRVAEIVCGITTQCVQLQNVLKLSPKTLSNICLKLNTKLGGINAVTEKDAEFDKRGPTIFLGAVVTHAPAGCSRRPAIAAVVGSMDGFLYRYLAEIRLQTNESEVIQDLTDIVRKLLISFYIATRYKPTKIIYYRTGVCESQFSWVLNCEVRDIRRACLMLDVEYQPGITMIAVEKKHHTRLFCADKRDQIGRSGNIPPGTTVDVGITHPTEFDFFLCSHAGVQGTSRLSHYHILWDENKFGADELQTMTYQLCYTYSICTKSISMPAPIFYANNVARRACTYLQHNYQDSPENSYHSGSDEEMNLAELNKSVIVHKDLKSSMFFV